jgi:hypothetical protein
MRWALLKSDFGALLLRLRSHLQRATRPQIPTMGTEVTAMIRYVTAIMFGMAVGYYVTNKNAVEQRTIGFNHGVQAAMHDEVTKNACLKVLFDIQEETNKRKKK